MSSSLRRTWHHTRLAVALAAFAVAITGFFIVRTFVRDVFVDCRGTLEEVSPKLIADPDLEKVALYKDDLAIRYDEVPRKRPWDTLRYKNVRVVWERTGVACACSDASVRWSARESSALPWKLEIYRDKNTGLYVVTSSSSSTLRSDWLAVFGRVDDNGKRFQAVRVFSPKHVPMLILFLALGALAIAAFRAARATPYATRVHAWQPATLRPDGLVESETGASIGAVDVRARVRAGAILVDPAALEGRDIYRAMPVLVRRNIAPGTHDAWYHATTRRFRDARALAIVSTITTALAVVGHLLGG